MSAAPAAIALNRFGLGARPEDAPPADPPAWLRAQFERYDPLPAPWRERPRSALLLERYQLGQRAVQQTEDARRPQAQQAFQRDLGADHVAAVAARAQVALHTPAPFVERLVHFWANHFAVSVDKLTVLNVAGALEADAIRPHVLGRFEDMLLAVVQHPAMLFFLDQATSVGPDSPAARLAAQRNPQRTPGLNENLAREILELHTLGVRSGYTQADVTEFARALTGFSVAPADAPDPRRRIEVGEHGFAWRANVHEPGRRTVLGRSYAQPDAAQARAILHDLARAEATARRIAFKLARHVVADEPPTALVDRLARVFLASDGDLPTLYRALVDSPEAWEAPVAKFKSPWDWVLSSLRALGSRELRGPQVVGLMNQLGQPVWRPGSPAGYDDVSAAWAAPDALLRRVETAQRLAALAGNSIDARALAPRVLPGTLGEETAQAVARSESPGSALALLLVSPEFLRR